LYDQIRAFDWHKLIKPTQSFAIDPTCYSDVFTHSHFTALKVKDAITDRIRDEVGRRPNVDTQRPQYGIHILMRGLEYEIYLDTTGEPLFKRGYREDGAQAPLNEALAAGLVLLSEWPSGHLPLWDPMCGSGTIPIEAALIKANVAPGLWRRHFSFMNWQGWAPEIWNSLKAKAEAQIKPDSSVPIYASDISDKMVRLAKTHAMAAEVRQHIEFMTVDFFKVAPPGEKGVILTNPPYDKRLTIEDAVDFYQEIGDWLKSSLEGWDAWIFSGQIEGMKHLGLRPSRKFNLMNGAIPCKFHKYELFSGKRKEHLAR
jgi:putative N6-adenine-specific DNA methylase